MRQAGIGIRRHWIPSGSTSKLLAFGGHHHDNLKGFKDSLLTPKKIAYNYVYKGEHWLHRLIGWFLALTKINTNYMKTYVTVIGSLFAIPDERRDLMWPSMAGSQMNEDAISFHSHERVHTLQALRDGKILFALRYMLSKKWRARYEGEAYGTSMYVDVRMGYGGEHWVAHVESTLTSDYGIPGKLAREQAFALSRLLPKLQAGYVRPIDEDLAKFLDQEYERPTIRA